VAPDSDEPVSHTLATGASLSEYYIASGVRRSVAAREVGHSDIAAKIVEPGKPDLLMRLSLDQLRSPKKAILRDGRYLRVETATRAKAIVTPIEVQPLGLPGQLSTVKLAKVQLS
jgi:hypothetical protein